MLIHTLLAFLFVVYYAYVMFVFHRLYQNRCNCKKLETFKKSWQYRFVTIVAPLFLAMNLYVLYKAIVKNQKGGFDTIDVALKLVSAGYALSFVHDYAIISLFNTMEEQDCPCQIEHRQYLKNATYVKLGINVLIYMALLGFMGNTKNKRKVKNMLKK